MARCSVKIIRRTKVEETYGWVERTIEFRSQDDGAARPHPLPLIAHLDWTAKFADLEGPPGYLRSTWRNAPLA